MVFTSKENKIIDHVTNYEDAKKEVLKYAEKTRMTTSVYKKLGFVEIDMKKSNTK